MKMYMCFKNSYSAVESHSREKMLFVYTKSLSVNSSLFKTNMVTFYRAKTGGWAVEMIGTDG